MAGPARAVGYPDYSSTGSSKFIPQIWSGKLVTKFYDATCFAEISNTDYEGEIKAMGDTVVIRTRPDIAINDYTIGGGLTYGKPSKNAIELPIDKAKSFAFQINSVDKYQSDLNLMDEWANDATSQMKIEIDRDLLAGIYSQVDANNAGANAGKISGEINLGTTGAPVTLTSANILEYITMCGQVLDEQGLPEEGRWIVLPAWATRRIKNSDLKKANEAGDSTSIIRNGKIGEIDGFKIFKNNQVASVVDGVDTCYHIPFGHKAGLTFASQMVNMETLPNPDDFGELCRGLNVYGFKVTEGRYIGNLYAKAG